MSPYAVMPLSTPLGTWRKAPIPIPGADSSHAAPTSTFITKSLDHYGLRLSFTAFGFFLLSDVRKVMCNMIQNAVVCFNLLF